MNNDNIAGQHSTLKAGRTGANITCSSPSDSSSSIPTPTQAINSTAKSSRSSTADSSLYSFIANQYTTAAGEFDRLWHLWGFGGPRHSAQTSSAQVSSESDDMRKVPKRSDTTTISTTQPDVLYHRIIPQQHLENQFSLPSPTGLKKHQQEVGSNASSASHDSKRYRPESIAATKREAELEAAAASLPPLSPSPAELTMNELPTRRRKAASPTDNMLNRRIHGITSNTNKGTESIAISSSPLDSSSPYTRYLRPNTASRQYPSDPFLLNMWEEGRIEELETEVKSIKEQVGQLSSNSFVSPNSPTRKRKLSPSPSPTPSSSSSTTATFGPPKRSSLSTPPSLKDSSSTLTTVGNRPSSPKHVSVKSPKAVHVDIKRHKETIKLINLELPKVQLRRTDKVRDINGNLVPNPIWYEIYRHERRH